jgi:DNA repair photolyase
MTGVVSKGAPFEDAPSPERLRGYLEALAGGLRVGDSLHEWTLVHLDTDEGLGYMFERLNGRLEFTLGPRDDRHPRFAQSRSFNLSYYVARQPGRPLPADARTLVMALATRILARDDGRAAMALTAEMTGRGGDIRTTRVETLLAPVDLDGARYYTANPYLGCLIGCSFCYAAPRVGMVRRLALLDDAAWGRYVLAKENAPEVLEHELLTLPRLPVVLSPLVADVYQSVERRLEITRRCLDVLRRHAVPTYILTRATLILRDLDILAQMPGSTFGFSVSTDDDDVGRSFEPRAALISERLDALGRLRAAGVRTVGVVQPILPMNPERLAQRLAEVCDLVRVDIFRCADAGSLLAAPAPTSGSVTWDERALYERLVAELSRLGVPRFHGHVPF